MYHYVKCPTCNCQLGHLANLFKAMRAQKNEHEDAEDLLDIFELLQVTTWCCKLRLMSVCEFNTYLHTN